MSLSVITSARLASLFTTNRFAEDVNRITQGITAITEEKYKREMPVWTGNARNSTVIRKKGDAYIITTTATNRGEPYPVYVHEGTGVFRGTKRDYPSKGRIRRNEVRQGIGGVRPNKFAKRARDQAEAEGIRYLRKEITKIIK